MKMNKDKIFNIAKDIIKSIIVGLVISLILTVISALVFTLVKHGGTKATLETVRSTLFIVGAFGLILYSGFILKRNARRALRNEWKWKEWFQVMSFVNVLLIVNIVILSLGIVIDNIRYYM